MTIAILCPTKGRENQCKRMAESCANTSSKEIVIYFGLTQEDYTIEEKYVDWCAWCNEFTLKHKMRVKVITRIFPDGMPTGYKWNVLAGQAYQNEKIKFFMLAADDIIFTTPCWDSALGEGNKIHVYSMQDSRDTDGTPHPIVTRAYVDAMGYFLPPIFLHWFVDSWTVAIAKHNNCFTYMRDFLLVHDKPSDKGICDKTHKDIRSMGWKERDQWTNDVMQTLLENEKFRLSCKMEDMDSLVVSQFMDVL